MKDNGYIIIGAIILILVWQSGIFDLFAIIPIQTNQFTSYTDIVREGSQCDIASFWTNNDLISSSTSVIPTLSSTFRFETTSYTSSGIFECIDVPSGYNWLNQPLYQDITKTYVDGDECQHWSYIVTKIIDGTCYEWCSYSSIDVQYMRKKTDCGPIECCPVWCKQLTVPDYEVSDYGGLEQIETEEGCFYSTKVYKDGILIDEIDKTSSSLQKAYSDDGMVYDNLPADKSGLEVDFGSQLFYTPACVESLECQVKNDYLMYLLSDDITIDISSPQEVYLEGEIVEINVEVINNFNKNLIGTLEIEYEVPTIFGPKIEIEEYGDLDINPGVNTFTYTIPTDVRTESLDITPTIKIYQPTSIYSGINVLQGFEEFGTERGPITAHDRIRVYTLTEETKTVRIKSEAESLREEIALLEGDIDLLQDLLNQKAQILNDLKLTLQEQLDIIEDYELLLEEKIYLVSQLELELEEQAQLILELTSISEEQAQYIDALNLSNQEQAILIAEMKLTSQQQADLIIELNLNIQEQSVLIDNLNLNLQQKIILISQLELTNQEQIDLINQMELSFAEQQEILDALNLIISDDAQQIIDLKLTIQESAEYIIELELSNQQMAQLIFQLELTNQEQADLIDALELTVEEKGRVIAELKLSLEEEAEIIAQLNLTIQEQIIFIDALELSFAEEQELVDLLRLTIEEEQAVIDGLKDREAEFDWSGFWETYKIAIILGGVVFILLIGGKRR